MNRKSILWISVAVLCTFIVIALAAPLIAPVGPTAITGKPLQPPDKDHLLGTNQVGQDIFAHWFSGLASRFSSDSSPHFSPFSSVRA